MSTLRVSFLVSASGVGQLCREAFGRNSGHGCGKFVHLVVVLCVLCGTTWTLSGLSFLWDTRLGTCLLPALTGIRLKLGLFWGLWLASL